MSQQWLYDLEEALESHGAVPRRKKSKDSHTIWVFPDGHRIWMPNASHGRDPGARGRANAEATASRAIARHGLRRKDKPKSPGHKPREVDTWQPVKPREEPTMDDAATTVTPTAPRGPWACPSCEYDPPDRKRLVAHQRKHAGAQACPECGETFRNLAQHQTLAHKGRKRPAKPEPEPPPATLEVPLETDTSTPLAVVSVQEILRVIGVQFEKLRGLVVKLEEENKMLRRGWDKSEQQVQKFRNLLKSLDT